ncbi:hypothetical protein BGZ95_004407 [Linnemannia exigua]|uniref:Cell wall galactomannoprotein n=1 Tax=Linnemannia exigua TaxID=604196 RepID=A0AAD4DLN2_9FUNG|nr:hypothetical protein BGZ95_004407 [Linnemannia exigua]
MRILSLSLSFAAIALVTAQAADPLTAVGAQNNYEWAPVSSQDLAAQVEDLSKQISEIEFRSHILSRLQQDPSTDFKAEGLCERTLSKIQSALETISGVVSQASPDPFVASVMRHIQQTVRRLIAMATAVGSSPDPPDTIVPITKLAIEPSSCYALADIYRGVTQDAAGSSPALDLPIDVPEDLKRLAGGSLTILDMLSKNSIAATNEALLSSRPIFAADILDQYRTELIRVTMDEEIKGYAVAALGSVVGVSNSLEACLRVAADPVAAIDELNEEMEAQAFYDEEEDEDKD